MENEVKTWLLDIQNAIQEIHLFLPAEKDFNVFKADLKTRRAIERNIEIIGEAIARILKADANFPIENARKIVDTRNRIIHGYDSVSDEILWSIVIRELPILEKKVSDLMQE